MNEQERRAARKVSQLVYAIEQANVENTLRCLPLMTDAQIAKGLRSVTADWWKKLASAAHVRTPSDETIAAVVAEFERRAREAA